MRTASLIILLLLYVPAAIAQEDKFIGLWRSVTTPAPSSTATEFSIHIGRPENGLLYPAQITIKSPAFSGQYHFLLVKKSNGTLAIGRNKFAVQEVPFSLGTWMIMINGSLVFSTNGMGKPLLQLNRIPAKRYGFTMPQLAQFNDSNRSSAIAMSHFIKDSAISLEKVSTQPWRSAAIESILYTYKSPVYFGLIDTLYTNNASVSLDFSETNKSDNDTVSVTLNGKPIIESMDINEQNTTGITLDTGLNILCFFADNYGRVPPNTAKMNIVFAGKQYMLDFTSQQNMSATFIVAKLYYYPDGKKNSVNFAAKQHIVERINGRKTVQIDSITATMSEITLALWDDAIEDGDSISLQINDEIYMPGIAVKKKPQFIKVNLYPGDNKIIFIADNLGAISPNTSVLEIIDGKRRKSYMINTNLAQNNSIKILYKPGQ